MENFKLIEFHETRDFSKKMSATFDFLKQNFKPLSKSLLFIAGPPVIIGSIFISDVFNRFVGLTITNAQNQGMGGIDSVESFFTSTTFWLQLLGIILFLWVGGVITVAVTYGYMKVYEEKKSNKVEVSEVWEKVRTSFWAQFATMTLYMITTLVIYFVTVLPLALVVGLFSVVSPFLTLFGMLGYYILVLFISTNLSLIFIIRGYEGIGFFKGLQRLFFLIKDKMWSTFGIGFINVLIQSTVSSIFFIPWYIILILSIVHQTQTGTIEEPSTLQELINSTFLTLYFVSNVLLYALPLIALAFQYFNLVELKEARELMAKIQSIGKPAEQAQRDEHY